MPPQQLTLDFGPQLNSNLFSNHWLTNRFHLEPEWNECRSGAKDTLDQLAALWKRERDRIPSYQGEQALEYAFIQPVLEFLGWKLNYQTMLQGRKPDYALFATDSDFDA